MDRASLLVEVGAIAYDRQNTTIRWDDCGT